MMTLSLLQGHCPLSCVLALGIPKLLTSKLSYFLFLLLECVNIQLVPFFTFYSSLLKCHLLIDNTYNITNEHPTLNLALFLLILVYFFLLHSLKRNQHTKHIFMVALTYCLSSHSKCQLHDGSNCVCFVRYSILAGRMVLCIQQKVSKYFHLIRVDE